MLSELDAVYGNIASRLYGIDAFTLPELFRLMNKARVKTDAPLRSILATEFYDYTNWISPCTRPLTYQSYPHLFK